MRTLPKATGVALLGLLAACDLTESPTDPGTTARFVSAPAALGIADFPGGIALLACHNLEINDYASVSGGHVHADGDFKIESENGVTGGDVLVRKNIELKEDATVGGSVRSQEGDIKADAPTWMIRVGGIAANPAGRKTLDPAQAAGGISHDPADYTFDLHCRDPLLRQRIVLTDADFSGFRAQAEAMGSYPKDVKVEAGGTGSYAGEHHIGGNLEIKAVPAGVSFDGLYYVAGDLKIHTSYPGRATFVVEGNLELKEEVNASAAPGASHLFIVRKDAKLDGRGTLVGSIYSGHNFGAKWEGMMHGSVVALNDVKLEHNFAINHVASTPPWFEEDFSAYTSSEHWRTVINSTYKNEPVNPLQQFIDPTVGFGAHLQSLRYEYPDRTADPGRCHDYPVLRNLWLPEPVDEVWAEAWIMFEPAFHTRAPEDWGCAGNPEMQALFGTISPDGGGSFYVATGVGGDGWAAGAPFAGATNVPGVHAHPYWDGAWHRVRVHWRLGAGDGVLRLWLEDELVLERTGLNTQTAERIWGLILGGYMQQGPEMPISYWWGRVRAWSSPPGW